MIKVADLSFCYSGTKRFSLRNLSFSCESAGITVAVGRSGIGKSTLIGLMAGMFLRSDDMVEHYTGSISIDGQAPERMRGPATVSWVPQAPLLLDHLTVLENVLLPMTIRDSAAYDMAEARAEALRLLDAMSLADWEHCRPRELSGGMMTRVSLLRALISKPKYLFLDEPFKGLDLVNRWSIYETIRDLRGASGMATFLTTHDIPEATALADRILLIQEQPDFTRVQVIDNTPVSPAAYRDGAGLEAAKVAAGPLEHRLFAHISPDDPGTF